MSHYYNHDHTDRTAYMVLGGLLGIGIGTVVGMLVAPREGRQSREQLRGKVNELQAKSKQRMEEGRRQARSTVEDVKNKAASTVGKVKDDAEDFRKDRERGNDSDW